MRIENPWGLQLALTYGCNRRCYFCATRILDIPEPRFMDFETFKKIIFQLKDWEINPRIDIAPFGEPLLNKEICKFLSFAIEILPKSYLFLTTNTDQIRNGLNLNFEKIKSLFNAGLNLIVLDVYDSREQFESYKKQVVEKQNLYGYKTMNESENHYKKGKHTDKLIKVEPLFEIRTDSRKRFNVGNNVDYDLCKKMGENIEKSETPLKSLCIKPFRELMVNYNGNVLICCNDWKQKLVIGNINDASLKNIWQGQKMNDIRKRLFAKDRDFEPCRFCNYFGGYRKGLISRMMKYDV